MIEAAGFVLAGGLSTRMGRNKALLRFGDETLIELALRKLRTVCPDVAIAGGVPELARYGHVIPDLTPQQGPLGGIVSALEHTKAEWNLFLPVDLPQLPGEALRGLLAASGSSAVTMATSTGRPHPLCAVIARAALPALRRELHAGNRRVRTAYEAAGKVTLWQAPDPEWFRNVNTPEDFAALAHPKSDAR